MAEVLQCDICKKIFNYGETHDNVDTFNLIKTYTKFFNDEIYSDSYYLCPECADNLYWWLRNYTTSS